MGKTVYICNKKREKCFEDGKICWEECYLTTDPDYAVNGKCVDPENHPERFKPMPAVDGDGFDYEERRYKNV